LDGFEERVQPLSSILSTFALRAVEVGKVDLEGAVELDDFPQMLLGQEDLAAFTFLGSMLSQGYSGLEC
jgi:hypothetical protein